MMAKIHQWIATDRYGVALVILGVTLGLVIGLALAWIVWPVEWNTDGLVVADGRVYVTMSADLFAFDLNGPRAQRAMMADGARLALCQAIDDEPDGAARARLMILAVINGVECDE